MTNLVEFFIKNQKLTIVLMFSMLFIGFVGIKNMKTEMFPPVDFATAVITTSYRGASAETIEAKITKPIEDEIRSVRFIKDVSSVSQPGLSRIIVRLDMDARGIDIPQTMGDLQRSVDRVPNLPTDLDNDPLFLEVKSEEIPVLYLAVSGGEESFDLEEVADNLKDLFEENKDVKNVALEGFSEREFQVILDGEKLERNYVGIDEVLEKIAKRNLNVPTGLLKGKSEQKVTRIEATVEKIEDIEEILARSTFSGSALKVKDIARVKDARKEKTLLTGYNGKDAVILSVTKKGNVDTTQLVKDLKLKLEGFQTKHPEFLFETYYDESVEIGHRLGVLVNNAISGLIIILLTLFLFLPWRTSIATAISLPLAILSTLGIIYFLGVNLHTMTILALVISLGMLLDDNVVIAENFVRLREEGKSPVESAVLSVKKLWLPVTATALTTIAAFMPMLVTKGIMGRFIQWIPITISLALILRLIECFFFLPMRLAGVPEEKDLKQKGQKKVDWFVKYEKKFERLTLWLIQRRKKALGGFFGLIFFSFFLLFVVNKFILFPSEQIEVYVGQFTAEEGSRLEQTHLLGLELSHKIKKMMGDRVEDIVLKTGRTDDRSTDPEYREGANCGSIYIYVDEIAKNEMKDQDVLEKLESLEVKGINKFSFKTIQKGPPVGSPIDVKFRSNNFDQLNKMIESIKQDLSKEAGISNLVIDDTYSESEIFIELSYEKLDRLGLTVDKVSQAIRTAIAGTIISDTTIHNEKIDILVRFQESQREDIEDLKGIKIRNNTGYLVPLENVAVFKNANSKPYIKRYDYKRTKSLIGQVDDKKMTSQKATGLIENLFEKYQKQYPEVSLSFKGVAESSKESMESLASAFKISIILIFALLVFLFRSYLKPLLILTTIPLGLVGISIGFFIQGIPLSFMAMIGIVGLSGIIVNSAIVLTSTIMTFEEEGIVKKKKLLPYASTMRLRSVIITAFTTIAGLFPTAYGIGGYDALISPLTMALVWGLLFGTVLTLLWIPCGYALLEDLNIWAIKKFERAQKWLKVHL
ncbi:MAG: efflux RND transporter permease subunit [Alphaproteobacteria bacterium]|nr:efflux RND transporter permease subunit [Alphaproteobacteria bacterium]